MRIILTFLLMLTFTARAVVFTSDTTISVLNTNYEGADIVVSNCVLTVDGGHGFNSLRVAGSGVLTHTASANGSINVIASVINEPQALTGTNAVPLNNQNVSNATVVVKDATATITYALGVDYDLAIAGSVTSLQRTTNSTIADGGTVLVSYDYFSHTVVTGLTLDITANLEVEPGASINADSAGHQAAAKAHLPEVLRAVRAEATAATAAAVRAMLRAEMFMARCSFLRTRAAAAAMAAVALAARAADM
jgi:hypothetical protein